MEIKEVFRFHQKGVTYLQNINAKKLDEMGYANGLGKLSDRVSQLSVDGLLEIVDDDIIVYDYTDAREVATFCEHLVGAYGKAFDEFDKTQDESIMDALYEKEITITFDGRTLKLPFGAIEVNALQDALDEITKEYRA